MSEAKVDADVETWRDVFSKFDKAVEECSDVDMLVKCLLEDDLWYIPFDSRMKLMEKSESKAESLGGCSLEFLADYYSFKTAFLDPGKEYDDAVVKLDELFQ
ncbi:hypothetical protein [Psychrobacter pacificensis]|uniref:hypothetical protein n=1 Tax=Psychrobacter pacificensis TaxID=112002 RepID=UPI001CBC4BAA|nr:hypothetical protein [Psychrobacter pacificensis]MBZ1392659.1 hypothetical protein [Psychrobacter pacificensis]